MRILTLALAVSVAAAASCTPDAVGPLDQYSGPRSFNPWQLNSAEETYGQIYATSATQMGNGAVQHMSGGQVFSTTSHDTGVDGGTLLVGDLPIAHLENGGYISMEAPTFGQWTHWGLSGNQQTGVPSFTDSMYSPAQVALVAPTYGQSLPRSADLLVTWNADVNNTAVILGFEYLVDPSLERDSTLPQSTIRWIIETSDDGSHVIPASAFSTLPIGGLVRLVVSRGASKYVGPTTRRYYAYSFSYAHLVMEVTT